MDFHRNDRYFCLAFVCSRSDEPIPLVQTDMCYAKVLSCCTMAINNSALFVGFLADFN